MKIFFSSLSLAVLRMLNSIRPELRPNVLLTYYGLNNAMDFVDKYRNMIGDIILDCGTYSLYQKYSDKAVRLREAERLFKRYKFFAKHMQHRFNFLFGFDEHFEPDGFAKNKERLDELEADGINAVPVLHNLSNNDVDLLIAAGYKMVAIGQCHGENRDDLSILWPIVDKLYSAGIKVHLFGMTTPRLISHVPAYSCDSKTWLDYGARGRVLFWNPDNPGLDKTDVIYFPKNQNDGKGVPGVYYHEYPYLDLFKQYIKDELGIEMTRLIGLRGDIYKMLVNVMYFLEIEKRVTACKAVEGITFD